MLEMTNRMREHTKGKTMVSDQTITSLPDTLGTELRKRIEQAGTQKAAAEQLEISAQHLGDLLHGNRTASPSLLEKLGLVKVVVHVKYAAAPLVVSAIGDALEEADRMVQLKSRLVKK
jgi:hypothetical protein